jgi:hypothetical protein
MRGSSVTKLFKIEIGTFKAKIDEAEGVNVKEMRPVVLDLIDRMIAYYEQRMAKIDQIIEQA